MSGLEDFFSPGKQSWLGDGAEHEASVRCGSYLSRCCQMRKAKTKHNRCTVSWIQDNSAAQKSEDSAAILTSNSSPC